MTTRPILRNACLLLLAAVQGCAFFTGTKALSSKTNNNNIKIGLVASFSGSNAGSGTTLLDSVNMAVDQVNTTGLLGGRYIQLVFGDDKSDPTTAVPVANDLLSQGAVALIGPNSSGSAADVLANVAKPKGLPMISPNASSPDFSDPSKIDGGGCFFRTCPSDSIQGKVIATKAAALGYKKMVVIHTDNSYGVGLANVMEGAFKGQGGTIQKDLVYPYNADPQSQASYDFENKVVKPALDQNPDAIMLVGYSSDASLIINAWITDGRLPKLKWIFTDATNRQDFIDNVKDKTRLQGQIGTAPYADPAFLTKFRAQFPNDPGVHGATAYDAMALIALAIAQSGQATPDAIRAHLRAVSGPDGEKVGSSPSDLATGLADAAAGKPIAYMGWSGPFNFDEHGDMASGKFQVWTVGADNKLANTDEVLSP